MTKQEKVLAEQHRLCLEMVRHLDRAIADMRRQAAVEKAIAEEGLRKGAAEKGVG